MMYLSIENIQTKNERRTLQIICSGGLEEEMKEEREHSLV